VTQAPKDIDALIDLMARLPGLGPRSARRAVLHLIKKRGQLLNPLAEALATVGATARECLNCGNIGTGDICTICESEKRSIGQICDRITTENITEVILALGATIDGQTTAHYIADELNGIQVTTLAQGVPVGGELDYLDDGTITAALNARKAL